MKRVCSSLRSRILMAGLVTVMIAGIAAPALASKSTQLATHRDWTAYTFMENGNKVCYLTTRPKKAEGDYTQRGDIYVFVTHRPHAGERNVFSVLTGYDYQRDSKVTVSVDGSKTFELFTQGQRAWARDATTDNMIIEALKAGKEMVVKGSSTRGTLTTDTYSLLGFTRAMQEIDRACPRR